MPVVAVDAGNLLERRGGDVVRFDGAVDFPRDVDERENVRLREDLAEEFEYLFPAAHPGEPIMNKCDAAAVRHGAASHLINLGRFV